MKKILYLITQSEMGGAQAYVRDLAVNLKNDFEILVAAGEQKKDSWLAVKMAKENIRFIALKNVKRSISPFYDFLGAIEITNLIKKERPDFVHLNSSKISILGSLAKIFASFSGVNPKIIYTAHGWVFNEPGRGKYVYEILEKFTAKFKDKIICVSEFDRLIAIKKNICSENKLITIHNGTGIKFQHSQEEARKKLLELTGIKMISKDEILIGSIGNLYKNKGFEYLINAIKIINDNRYKIRLFIIGSGDLKKELENEIAQLHLKNIHIISGIEDAQKYLPAFDIYACSSVKEGLSYTIIEAMLSELPIVATDVGGNPELIAGGAEGLLIKSKNPEALAGAIQTLIDDDKLRHELAKNAQVKAIREFGLKQMVERTRDVYLNL